ncbi:hypothetical protein LguiB_031379 [Lonicera macranthoides]
MESWTDENYLKKNSHKMLGSSSIHMFISIPRKGQIPVIPLKQNTKQISCY